jgi:hypothetical protein
VGKDCDEREKKIEKKLEKFEKLEKKKIFSKFELK